MEKNAGVEFGDKVWSGFDEIFIGDRGYLSFR